MINFDLGITIFRPVRQVFRFIATPENNFQWQYGTLTSVQISKGEMGTGSLFRAVVHFMGQRRETLFEVTGFEPDKIYGFKSLGGPMLSHTVYTFEVSEGRTQIKVSEQVHLDNFFKPTLTLIKKS